MRIPPILPRSSSSFRVVFATKLSLFAPQTLGSKARCVASTTILLHKGNSGSSAPIECFDNCTLQSDFPRSSSGDYAVFGSGHGVEFLENSNEWFQMELEGGPPMLLHVPAFRLLFFDSVAWGCGAVFRVLSIGLV